MNKSLAKTNHYNQKNLLKRIFQSDSPEKLVRELPTQALYLTIKQNGLPDCLELIELCTVEQCQLFLDLDCWNGDEFNEENFWHWLELPDSSEGSPNLDILKKILRSTDLKLVAHLLSRYVNFLVYDEPTDEPPDGDCYTPDQGHTWVNVIIPDPHRNFLLNRFLACIFDVDPRIFYQLMNIPSVATPIQLEEESFQDKQKRMESEGFPSWERSLELNTPIKLADVFNRDSDKNKIRIIKPVELPVPIFQPIGLMPLTELWQNTTNTLELDGELTMLINSALIRWKIALDDFEKINFCAEQVTGAINIGLDLICKKFSLETSAAYQQFLLQKLYRIGLGEIYALQKLAKKISKDQLKVYSQNDQEFFEQIAGILENFPLLAVSQRSADGELVTEYQPFRHLPEINQLQQKIQKIFE